MTNKSLNLIILLILSTLILASNANARMKCWTNSDGVKECGDKVPPEYTQQGYQELGKGGIVREETNRVRTKEELQKEKVEADAKARKQKEIKSKRAHDKMLLETFTSIDEIEETRQQKIEAIDSTIKVVKKRIIKLQYSLDDELDENSIDKQIDGEEKKSNDSESLKKQISENKSYIKKKIDEKEEIKKTYLQYITRFRELKGLD
jgi:hypothetical protein